MAEGWYYTHKGQTHGPVSTAEIKRLAASGGLLPEDPIWQTEAGRQLAVPASAALDFAQLEPPKSSGPEWLRDVQALPLATEQPKPTPGVPDWIADVSPPPLKASAEPVPTPSWMIDFQPAEAAYRTHPVPDWLASFVPVVPAAEAKPVAPPAEPRAQPVPATPAKPPDRPPIPAKAAGTAPVPLAPPAPPARPAPPLAMPVAPKASPAPSAASPTSPASAKEMGYDPDTGQVHDPVKFKQWQQRQKAIDQQRLAVQPAGPATDPFEKARRELADWVDREDNELLLRAGNRVALSRQPFLFDFMHRHEHYGPEFVKRLCHYLDFIVENRMRFYQKRS